ncbi:MAG: hypothetical protein J0H07_30150 [Sphingobacteriales bacterium]|nr:hypothetical protein [Sphingobacteriales bacterium]
MRDTYAPQLKNEIRKCIQACCYETVLEANAKMLWAFWKIGDYIFTQNPFEIPDTPINSLHVDQICSVLPTTKNYTLGELSTMGLFAGCYSRQLLCEYTAAVKHTTSLGDIWMKDPDFNKNWCSYYSNFPSLFLESIITKLPWGHHIALLDREIVSVNELFVATLSFIQHRTPINSFKQQIEDKAFQNERKFIFDNGTGSGGRSYQYDSTMFRDILKFISPETDLPSVKRNFREKIWKTILRSNNDFAYKRSLYTLKENLDVDLLLFDSRRSAHIIVDLERDNCTPDMIHEALKDHASRCWQGDAERHICYVIGRNDPAWLAEQALFGINDFNRVLDEIIPENLEILIQ